MALTSCKGNARVYFVKFLFEQQQFSIMLADCLWTDYTVVGGKPRRMLDPMRACCSCMLFRVVVSIAELPS